MIKGEEMYRKAVRLLAYYEGRVKSGEATPEERERCATIRDHVMVYEWAQDGRPAEVSIPREPDAPVDPVVRQFADWWERVWLTNEWFHREVEEGFAWWWAPRRRELTEELEEQILDELEARGMIRTDPMDALRYDRPHMEEAA